MADHSAHLDCVAELVFAASFWQIQSLHFGPLEDELHTLVLFLTLVVYPLDASALTRARSVDYLSSKPNHKLYILILYIAYWILPTVLISISYIVIIVTFKRSSIDLKKIGSAGSASTGGSERLQSQDSFRLRPANNLDAARLNPFRDRRASTSVVDLSSCQLVMQTNLTRHEEESTGATVRDKRRLFKRVVSSSALPSRVAENNQRPSCRTEANKQTANDQWLQQARPGSTRLTRLNPAATFRPRIIKTFSNIKAPLQKAANSQLTRTVLQFRLAKMSFYLILLWLVSWTPIASLAMMNSVMRCRRASATAVFLASTMTKLGPALDVFIYGIAHPKIKSRFKQIIGRLILLDDSCGKV